MLEKELREKMIGALKCGDKRTKEVYSGMVNALTLGAKENRGELTPEQEISILSKMAKNLNESIELCPASRNDLLEQYKFELNIIGQYLPKQMDDADILSAITETLNELGLSNSTPKDKGTIMKVLMPKVKGKADGKKVNQILGTVLNN